MIHNILFLLSLSFSLSISSLSVEIEQQNRQSQLEMQQQRHLHEQYVRDRVESSHTHPMTSHAAMHYQANRVPTYIQQQRLHLDIAQQQTPPPERLARSPIPMEVEPMAASGQFPSPHVPQDHFYHHPPQDLPHQPYLQPARPVMHLTQPVQPVTQLAPPAQPILHHAHPAQPVAQHPYQVQPVAHVSLSHSSEGDDSPTLAVKTDLPFISSTPASSKLSLPEDEGHDTPVLKTELPSISITSPPASSSSPATAHYTCPSCGVLYQGDKGLHSGEERCASCSGSDGKQQTS